MRKFKTFVNVDKDVFDRIVTEAKGGSTEGFFIKIYNKYIKR